MGRGSVCALAIRRRKGRRLSFRKLKPREPASLSLSCMCSNINTNTHTFINRAPPHSLSGRMCFYSVNDLINTTLWLVSRTLCLFIIEGAHASLGRGGAYLICMYARTLSKTRRPPPPHQIPLPCIVPVSDECYTLVCARIAHVQYIDFAGPLFSLSIPTPAAPVTPAC